MLLAKIYAVSWVLVAGMIGIFYFTDSFTYASAIVLGFITSILGGAGLLVVYPVLMSEDVSSERRTLIPVKPEN